MRSDEALDAIRRVDQDGDPPAAVLAGAAIYSPLVLSFYDAMVMGFANEYAWKCPTRLLRDRYQAHVSSNHLEVGVGTGYHLDQCRFPSGTPRIVLADLNANALHKAARRVRRFRPRAYQLNVLSPFQLPEEPFDSISMNYLLHCLPGTLSEKAVAFDHLLPLLKPGGVVFGSTILSVGVELGSLARAFLALYNRMGVINNAGDTLADLEACLRSRFSRVELRVVGSVALFSGSVGSRQGR
jgi:ubiquinone/menaquinone biosynthesis C-methylase UbiE